MALVRPLDEGLPLREARPGLGLKASPLRCGGTPAGLTRWRAFPAGNVGDAAFFDDHNDWASERGSMTQQKNSGADEPDSPEK